MSSTTTGGPRLCGITSTFRPGSWRRSAPSTSPDGRILFANAATCETVGYSPDELRLLNVTDLHAPGSREAVLEVLTETLADRAEHCPYPLVTRDGRTVPVETRVVAGRWRGEAAVFGSCRETRNDRLLQAAVGAMLDVLEVDDAHTARHGRCVARLARQLGDALGLDRADIAVLSLAATIHDVGYVGVPVSIRSNPGRLSLWETEVVKTHPEVGRRMLRSLDDISPIPAVVLQHHERLDGFGYPHGLAGDEIMLPARVIAVADTVVDMAMDSPRRPAQGLDAALAAIRRQGGAGLDADVVAACLELYESGRIDWLRGDDPAAAGSLPPDGGRGGLHAA